MEGFFLFLIPFPTSPFLLFSHFSSFPPLQYEMTFPFFPKHCVLLFFFAGCMASQSPLVGAYIVGSGHTVSESGHLVPSVSPFFSVMGFHLTLGFFPPLMSRWVFFAWPPLSQPCCTTALQRPCVHSPYFLDWWVEILTQEK